MADFLEVPLADGGTVLFQTIESDLVELHADGASKEDAPAEAALARLSQLAHAADQACQEFRTAMRPDSLELQIAVGLSGEVGWFFAKSQAEASLQLTLTWGKS